MKQSGITLILCLAVISVVGCDNRQAEESRKRQNVEAEHERTKQAIDELAKAHNAVLNWRQGLAAKEPVGRIYSVELAPVLIRSDGRPLLFIADALDVSSTTENLRMPRPSDIFSDPQFINLPTDRQVSVLSRIDKNYAALPRDQQLSILNSKLSRGSPAYAAGKDYVCSFQVTVNASRSIRLILGCTPEQATQIIHDAEGRYAVVARVTSLGSAVPRPDEDDNEKEHAWFPAYGECLGELNLGKDYLDDLFELWSFPVKKTDQ